MGRKIPPVNHLQMCKFLNPSKSLACVPLPDRRIWLPTLNDGQGGKRSSVFPSQPSATDGLHLWNDTFLNDAVTGAHAAVLNSATVHTRTCLFISPDTSATWQHDDILNAADHNQANCKRDPCCNTMNLRVDPKDTCGRRFLIRDAFRLGFKNVYFPIRPNRTSH